MEPSGYASRNSNDSDDVDVTDAVKQLSLLDTPERNLSTSDERGIPSTQDEVTPSRWTNIMAQDRKRVVDVTDIFRSASAALPIGVLVKDESFPLQETVGALEIMDTKMDSGALAPGEAFEDIYNAADELRPEEVLGVMDQLLRVEMAWHQGYPLSQTILTSHYIDKLLSKETRQLHEVRFSAAHPLDLPILLQALRAYCLALIKSCDLVLKAIKRSPYYEEEDFSTQLYNRDLLSPIDRHDIIEVMDRVIQDLGIFVAHSSKQEVVEAILVRVGFRKDLLSAMPLHEDIDTSESTWKCVCESTYRHSLLHSTSKPVPAAFSKKIQRKLYGTAPPRPIVELDFETAMDVLVKICNDCQESTRIQTYSNSKVEGLKAFMWSFSSRNPPPLPFSRACLSSRLFENGNFESMLRQDLTNWVFPLGDALNPVDSSSSSPARYDDAPYRIKVSQCISQFTLAATAESMGYLDMFRALCQNRCRLRRLLPHVLRDLDALEERSFFLDNVLADLIPTTLRNLLSTWTLCQRLQVAQWVIQLGFEQDVYLQHELAGMYWFLSRICRSYVGFLTEISKHTLKVQQSSGLRPEQREQCSVSSKFLESLILRTRATAFVAEGLHAVYTHLTYLGLIHAIGHPYGQPNLLFELRMRSILKGSLLAPDFDTFNKATHPLGSFEKPTRNPCDATAQICQHVTRVIMNAKKDFQQMISEKLGAEAAFADEVQGWWQEDVEKQIAACDDLLLSINVMRETVDGKSPDGLSISIPDPGARRHEWWVVPNLTA
ncbi:Mak10-domain-containing protein [Eremomyces bilateralis CBS 781.70]|uniref:Mak10-domain-containing protein n=1 Tax=Eremomyces bilateralis CBS 781.70 TaxID=1392243 RepID=A0A6G1G8W3_9PEZI|nr:Mak10-domain-containing protein [Eremomyces bilateralis CBS 781.70]KAF1814453.1 Mak10-domain-containing protein [Eremomyces bilateralis CBS 781.70]